MAFNIITKNTVADRFKYAPRPDVWKDVEDKDWNNWIWQQQKRVKSLDQLEKVVNVTTEEREAFQARSQKSETCPLRELPIVIQIAFCFTRLTTVPFIVGIARASAKLPILLPRQQISKSKTA